jgi:endoglucanase
LASTLSRGQITAIAVAGSLAFVAIVAAVFGALVTGGTDDPFDGRRLYVYPDSTAAQALPSAATDAERSAFQTLADTPTAVWLLPESHPTSEIADFVAGVAGAADDDDALPVFVVYGIPDRDCTSAGGGQSAGGTSDADYPAWTAAIARGLAGKDAVLILEPDSLSLVPDCGNGETRAAQLGTAIDALAADGTTIYLDGGHSTWRTPEVQADLLNSAGIAKVRGFATNVSNFNTTADEVAYAERVSALTDGASYVIDTSRNGNGNNGEWCNPSGRKIGDAPAAKEDGAHDANLWIKAPGESDGECNGGPSAGAWWPARALALVQGY